MLARTRAGPPPSSSCSPPAFAPRCTSASCLPLVEAGFLLSLIQLPGMAAALAVGLAVDSFGGRRSMLCGLATLAIASAVGGFAREPWQLMVLRAVEGFGFLLARLPLELGLWSTYMPTGTALVLLCGPWVMALAGWQGLWWSLAALSAAIAV